MYNPKTFSEDGLVQTLKDAIALAKSVWMTVANVAAIMLTTVISCSRHRYSSR